MASQVDSIVTSILPTFCLECGAPVAQVTRMRREYCSDSCKAERKRRLRKVPLPPVCNICGGPFERTSNRQKVCADCREAKTKAYNCAYIAENLEEIRKKRREGMRRSRADEPEKFRERDRQWRQRNRSVISQKRRSPEYREKAAARLRKRYTSDPAFAVHARMASAVYQAIRGRKSGRKWEALVGYSVDDLMAHLERQFSPGMSWENMGEWHIDHITPKAAFIYKSDDDPEFRACWALANLRPLWKGDNQKKHAKRLFLI